MSNPQRFNKLGEVPKFQTDEIAFAKSVINWATFISGYIMRMNAKVEVNSKKMTFLKKIGDYIIVGDIKIVNESGDFVVYSKDGSGNFTIELTRSSK